MRKIPFNDPKGKKKKTFLIALGGSIIIPSPEKININFLKKFRTLILDFINKGCKFIIVAGGGKICRTYQNAASKIIKLPYEDQDWIGIHATRLNAHLLRAIFRRQACPVVLDNPYKPIKTKQPIIIAAGWRPGWSTDYIAVLLAKRFKIKEIIDAGNIPFVFNKDSAAFKRKNKTNISTTKQSQNNHNKANCQNYHKKNKPIKEISWHNYQKLINHPPRWIPGLSFPIDPIAAKLAKKLKLKAIIVQGTDLQNLKNILKGKNFKGTIIS